MRLLLSALLVCASACTQLAHAKSSSSGFIITPGEVKKVAANAQVSKTQLFSRSWQIRANPSENASTIDELSILTGTRVFISYAEAPASAASDALGEVKFSGNSEAIVTFGDVTNTKSLLDGIYTESAVVGIRSYIFPSLPTQASYLLTEVFLYKKRQLKRVDASVENAVDDIVIGDNVLYTAAKDVVKTYPKRATAVGAPIKADKYSDEFGSAYHVEPIKDANTTRAVKIGVKTTFTGNITLRVSCGLWIWGRTKNNVARVGVSPYMQPTTPVKYNVTVTPGAEFDTLVVHVNSTLASVAAVGFIAYVETVPTVQIDLADLPPNVIVDDACNIKTDSDNGLLFRLDGVARNVFIQDKDAVVYAKEALVIAPLGNLQVEVKELTASTLTLQSDKGNINFFSSGAMMSDYTTAAPNFGSKICLASSNDVKVALLDSRSSAQVSYTGRAGGNAFTCTKLTPPQRIPAPVKRTGATEESPELSPAAGDKSSSSKSSTSHVRGSYAVAVALAVVGLTVAM